MLFSPFLIGALQLSAARSGRSPTQSRSALIRASAVESPTLAPLIQAATASGPVAVDASDEAQAAVESAAVALRGQGAAAPADIPLRGTYSLLYSAAKGGSNGKLGPLTGTVQQIIVDETSFINQVDFFGGALCVQLHAERERLDEERIRVNFKETSFRLLGNELVRKPTNGSGVWVNEFVQQGDDGESAGFRVMRTPSLFVLQQQ